jgi:two-component system KDP operon response regulator KdpE
MSDRSRVLVCDDDSQSLRALRVALHAAGFEVDETGTAKEALDHAALRAPNAAILEVVLLDGDGVDLCQRLRKWSAMPLIMLSAIDEEGQKVRALEAGADDYLTKPFAASELVARLHATQRRVAGLDQPHVVLDGLQINLAGQFVHREGREVHLTPIEFKLLRLLVQHRGRLLTHSALLREVWGTAYEGDRQTLRTHIANLRRKVEPAEGQPLIGTHHGVGYRITDSHSENAIRTRPAPPRRQSLAALKRDGAWEPRLVDQPSCARPKALDHAHRRAA